METRIRFRTDGSHIADLKAQGKPYHPFYDQAIWDATPPAQPGDIWRVHWHAQDAEGNHIDGPFAGYYICCPGCRRVHAWTTANNCSTRRRQGSDDGMTCDHMGKGSCWNWSGSAEAGTLTASPSLHSVQERGGCGWHGWLQNGVLRG